MDFKPAQEARVFLFFIDIDSDGCRGNVIDFYFFDLQSLLTELLLGEPRTEEIKYDGRHLFTNEVVEQMEIKQTFYRSKH